MGTAPACPLLEVSLVGQKWLKPVLCWHCKPCSRVTTTCPALVSCLCTISVVVIFATILPISGCAHLRPSWVIELARVIELAWVLLSLVSLAGEQGGGWV